MSFQVGIGSLGGTVFSGGTLYPSVNYEFVYSTKWTYSLYLHCIYAYTGSYITCIYMLSCLQQLTLGIVFDYFLGTFIVHVDVGFSYIILMHTLRISLQNNFKQNLYLM